MENNSYPEKRKKRNNRGRSRQKRKKPSPETEEEGMGMGGRGGGRGRGRGMGRRGRGRGRGRGSRGRGHQQYQQNHQQQQQQQQPTNMNNNNTSSSNVNVNNNTSASKNNSKKYYMTEESFGSLNIDARLARGISDILQYETMTRVQSQTIPISLSGVDLLAQAKTGTGKTLAFLIPAIQSVNKSTRGIKILIISPTRELANQICTEANKLTHFYQGFNTVSMVGGTKKTKDKRMISQGISLLVATPGRLLDHLANTPNFKQLVQNLSILILDEADQMLEMGFRPDLTKIASYLPQNRQTLLFSATMPPALMEVCQIVVKPDFQYINTIPKSEQQTHKSVPQKFVVAPINDLLTSVLREIKIEIQKNPHNFKIMAFFVTARLVGYMAEFLRNARLPVVEIHSRKSQSYRTKASNKFRDGNKMIMTTSNVSARGVDYPDVSLVLQVGLTDREVYIHRIGRTARAQTNVNGRGVLLLHPFEKNFSLGNLKGLPIEEEKYNSLDNEIYGLAQNSLTNNPKGLRVPASQAYQSWLGYYNTYLKKLRLSKENLVENAYEFARTINALDENGMPPALQKRTVGKMNLKGVRGLNIMNKGQAQNFRNNRGNNRGRGGGNRGGYNRRN